jgi:ATP/maltotriose-dependent transcriptional regulator MalT
MAKCTAQKCISSTRRSSCCDRTPVRAQPVTEGRWWPIPAATRREAEVLALIAQGLSNQDIGARLFVSEATVKTHINNLFSKIGARGRGQAVAYAYRQGLEKIPGPAREPGPGA